MSESRAGEPGGAPGQGDRRETGVRFHWLLPGEVAVLSGKDRPFPAPGQETSPLFTGTRGERVPVNTSQLSFSPTATTRGLLHAHIFLLKSPFISPSRMIRRNIEDKSKDVQVR